MRRLVALVVLVASSIFVPTALADGQPLSLVQGGSGVLSPDGKYRYVAVSVGTGGTAIERIRIRGGLVRAWTTLHGYWGVPTISFSALDGVGLSHDGAKLVVGTYGSPSHFAVIQTRNMRVVERVTVNGNFSYDALSPDASRLYLIQHVDQTNLSRYVVRAYDLQTRTLLPGRIADRTQKRWVMEGWPVTRTTSRDGRWVYTLYSNPGGYPFVHALDTVRGVAHCTGIPLTGNQNALSYARLKLEEGGRTLAIDRRGHPWFALDTVSWRMTPVQPSGELPWTWILAGTAGALALLLTLASAARASRRAALASSM